MNFVREDETDTSIKQVKEYFLADYKSDHMHFDTDETKGLKVTVVDANGNNVTKDADGNTVDFLDYSEKVTDFFTNDGDETDPDDASATDVFGTNGKGIMVPWVKVVKATEQDPDPDPDYPIYTTSKVKVTGEDGEETIDTYYVYSLYNSDVTIVVDYYMILDDDAIVDEPGNKNYAQYGYNPVEPKDAEPTPPSDKDKPSQKKEVDEATVYTFALAFVKIDDHGESLANASFKLPFYVKEVTVTKDEADAEGTAGETAADTSDEKKIYVYAGEEAGEGLTNIVTTDESGVITIKGVKQGVYPVEETEAPVGFNKLVEPFTVEAKKSGESVTVITETTIYLDENGVVTSEETQTAVVKNTDGDQNVDNVPVYQFNPIINKKGTELPSTGGAGTTMFYVIGTILVLGAGLVLVTKKRMSVR